LVDDRVRRDRDQFFVISFSRHRLLASQKSLTLEQFPGNAVERGFRMTGIVATNALADVLT
jgi:hypothetical protein